MVWIITVNYWITFIWAIHGLELGCGNNIFWIHLGKWILWWTKKCTKKSIFTFFWCCHYFLNEFFDYKLSFCKNYVLQPFFMTCFTTLILVVGKVLMPFSPIQSSSFYYNLGSKLMMELACAISNWCQNCVLEKKGAPWSHRSWPIGLACSGRNDYHNHHTMMEPHNKVSSSYFYPICFV